MLQPLWDRGLERANALNVLGPWGLCVSCEVSSQEAHIMGASRLTPTTVIIPHYNLLHLMATKV